MKRLLAVFLTVAMVFSLCAVVASAKTITSEILITDCESTDNWYLYPGDPDAILDTNIYSEGKSSVNIYQSGGFACGYYIEEGIDLTGITSLKWSFRAGENDALTTPKDVGVILTSASDNQFHELVDPINSTYAVKLNESQIRRTITANEWTTMTADIDWSTAGSEFDITKVNSVYFYGMTDYSGTHYQWFDNIVAVISQEVKDDSISVSLGDIECNSGDTISVPVNISLGEDYTNIAAFQSSISYDEQVLEPVEDFMQINKDVTSYFNTDITRLGAGKAEFAFISSNGVDADSLTITLNFKVKEGLASNTVTKITLDKVIASDDSAVKIPNITKKDSTVKISSNGTIIDPTPSAEDFLITNCESVNGFSQLPETDAGIQAGCWNVAPPEGSGYMVQVGTGTAKLRYDLGSTDFTGIEKIKMQVYTSANTDVIQAGNFQLFNNSGASMSVSAASLAAAELSVGWNQIELELDPATATNGFDIANVNYIVFTGKAAGIIGYDDVWAIAGTKSPINPIRPIDPVQYKDFLIEDGTDIGRWSWYAKTGGTGNFEGHVWMWYEVSHCLTLDNPISVAGAEKIKIDLTGSYNDGDGENTPAELFARINESTEYGFALTSYTGALPNGGCDDRISLNDEAWTTYGVRFVPDDAVDAKMNTFTIDWNSAGASFDPTAVTGLAIVGAPGSTSIVIKGIWKSYKVNDLDAAKSVDDKIASLGEITLDKESDVAAARTAYAALTDAQKSLVENLDLLEAAETKIAELKEEAAIAAANAEAAKAVDDQIAALGEITLDKEADVVAARAAYEALTDAQKALVEKLDVLTAAEKAIEDLKNPKVPELNFNAETRSALVTTNGSNVSKVLYAYIGTTKLNIDTWAKFVNAGKKYTAENGASGYKYFTKNIDYNPFELDTIGWYCVIITVDGVNQYNFIEITRLEKPTVYVQGPNIKFKNNETEITKVVYAYTGDSAYTYTTWSAFVAMGKSYADVNSKGGYRWSMEGCNDRVVTATKYGWYFVIITLDDGTVYRYATEVKEELIIPPEGAPFVTFDETTGIVTVSKDSAKAIEKMVYSYTGESRNSYLGWANFASVGKKYASINTKTGYILVKGDSDGKEIALTTPGWYSFIITYDGGQEVYYYVNVPDPNAE